MSFPIGSLEDQIQGLQHEVGNWRKFCYQLQDRLEVLENGRIVRPTQVQTAWWNHQGDTVEQICAVADSVVIIDKRLQTLEAAVEELDTPYQLKLKIDFLEDQLIALKERLHKSASVLTQQLWLAPDAVGLYSEPACHSKPTGAVHQQRSWGVWSPVFPLSS